MESTNTASANSTTSTRTAAEDTTFINNNHSKRDSPPSSSSSSSCSPPYKKPKSVAEDVAQEETTSTTDVENDPMNGTATATATTVATTTASMSTAIVRRGSRQRTSTTIQVNGFAVKKLNNYEPKAFTYEYGVNDGDDVQQKQPARLLQPQKAAPKKTLVPRAPTQLEMQRKQNKDTVQSRIHNKAASRLAFFQEHAPVLQPFVHPKVLDKLRSCTSTVATTAATKPTPLPGTALVSMQPESITADAEMRDYQMDGLSWMAGMYERNVGCILGDEMGLGKTLQTISLICHIKEQYGVTGPSLVICPLSVLYSWCSEIQKWAPSLQYLRFHSSCPESMEIPDLQKFDIIITTYEMAKTSHMTRTWSRQHFNLLVLDEGHRIKGIQTQISQAVRKIHAEQRMILSGTPLANNLVELYSLLSFLCPDIFTTVEPFEAAFNLTLNVIDPAKLNQAHKLLDIFMVRRLKTEVEKLIPPKIETKVVCPLSTSQIWWYKAMLLKDISILAKDSSGASKANRLNNLLMQLRKVCLHPFLFPNAEDIDATTLENLVGSSGKLAVLDKLLRSLFVKEHRVCLFSQFTSILDILEDYCVMRGWKYCRFDGGTSRAKRNFVINSFNAPGSDKFLFLMSTRSGGMGLNLQTADTVILYDSDWNPQPDIQAMARVHRIGQPKTVHVYRLVTEGTVEARMVERAEQKLYLDRMVTRDGAAKHDESKEEDEDGKLMSTLRFGCNAVFGTDSENQSLPSAADIEVITDRSRTEDFSYGNLKGGAEQNAEDFDIGKQLSVTTEFGGIDFKQIRDKHKKSKLPDNVNAIGDAWRKRQRKNRIKMVQAKGSGYGAVAVPVLAMNDYDLETGERSVFQQELGGRTMVAPNRKAKPSFTNQDHCQVCGDGGELIMCPSCPVSVHADCVGLTSAKEFLHCPHHFCAQCQKTASRAGGFLFACSCCPNAYCEDCVPQDARMLEENKRMEALGWTIKNGTYIHCNPICENVAVTEFDWSPPKSVRGDCPPELDVSSYFGGQVDDNVEDAPEDLIVTGKRQRKATTAYSPGVSTASGNVMASTSTAEKDAKKAAIVQPKQKGDEVIQIDSSDSDDSDYKPAAAAPPLAAIASSETQKPHNPPARQSQVEYDAFLPVTPCGLLLAISTRDGSFFFNGYRRDADGRPGPAERSNLVRHVGDELVAVNNVCVSGKSMEEVVDLLAAAKDQSQTVRIRFRTKAGAM